MNEITTPGQVITEMHHLMNESEIAVKALYDAEIKVAELDAAYQRTEALAVLNSEGTAQVRTAIAKIESGESKLALDIAKAELNHIKAHLRRIDSAQIATSVIAKQVELMWRHA